MLHNWLPTWALKTLHCSGNICARETGSKNKSLVRSSASLLSNRKQRALARPCRATVSIHSSMQGSLMTRTEYTVQTARIHFIFLHLKSVVLLFLSLKAEGKKFKHVIIGISDYKSCSLCPETDFSLMRCRYKIPIWVYYYIITTRRNSGCVYHQKEDNLHNYLNFKRC